MFRHHRSGTGNETDLHGTLLSACPTMGMTQHRKFVQGLRYFYIFFAIGKQGIAHSGAALRDPRAYCPLSIQVKATECEHGRPELRHLPANSFLDPRLVVLTVKSSRTQVYNSLESFTMTHASSREICQLNPYRHLRCFQPKSCARRILKLEKSVDAV